MPTVQTSNESTNGMGNVKGRLGLAAILGSLVAIGPLSVDMYLPSLPILAKDLGAGTSLAQLSLTACLLGIAIGQLLAGSLSDRMGRRQPLLSSLIIYVLATILCAESTSIWMFIIFRFIQGISGAAGIVISRAIVRDLYSGTELTRMYATLMLVTGAAPILAPVAGGFILKLTSWRGVFMVLSMLGLLMFAGVWFRVSETLAAKDRLAGGAKAVLNTYKELLVNRNFMGFILTQAIAYSALFAYISGSPFILQEIYGASPQLFSMFFAMNGLGLILFSQITGRLVRKIPERGLLTVGLVLAVIGGVALLSVILAGIGLIGVLAALFVVVASFGVISVTCTSLAMQDQKKSAGSASALLGLIQFSTGAVVAPLVGISGSHTAVPMGMIIAISTTGALLNYLFFILMRKGPSPNLNASRSVEQQQAR
ncbi:multidrug effflux MFS transporter [Ferviditalea candida]|uniref:Bcr/CflA family efflux transporter n=1 Tax=Ferviditalea candida TaxID=3108399 RepID=A0ABU5ZHF4_9BACL|nr:multidrug effflux MFS transporter [Paenibacillaceae bacterium T2]